MDGIDTESGRRRPRQLGTFASQRAARNAAADAIAEGRQRTTRQTVADLVDRWVASHVDVGVKQREQYEWAATHIKRGLGGIVIHDLDSSDIAAWIDALARQGQLGRRSIQIVRMTLRAAFAAAVQSGELTRNPAAGVPMPRHVERVVCEKEADAWDDDELDRFLEACRSHRWGGPMRLEVLYGLRRSELLALVWDNVDLNAASVTIKAGLIEAQAGLYESEERTPAPGEQSHWTMKRRTRCGPTSGCKARSANARKSCGTTTAWSLRRTSATESDHATTTRRSTASSFEPACHDSRPTGFDTPPPRTWSPPPQISGRFAPPPMSSATAPKCL